MIEFHYWPTPNGHKVTIFLEETGLDYKIFPVNIGKDEQFKPEYLKISPNNKMPAIVDHKPLDGGAPLSVFESGAILQYLALKSHKFYSVEPRHQAKINEWLFWQVGGLGPMAGQNHHFNHYAKEKIPYAQKRYLDETARLYGVLDRQLSKNAFVAGEYSIADMAIYPWIEPHEMQGQDLKNFPNIKKWFEKIAARPAVVAAYAKAKTVQ